MRQGCQVTYLESPTNPTLTIMELARLAKAGGDAGAAVVVDNTFATLVNQNPVDLGVHLVVHSAARLLGSHADALGVVVCRPAALTEDPIADLEQGLG